MNAYSVPYARSLHTATTTRAPRDIEYDAFSHVTAGLKRAQEDTDPSQLTVAIHKNNTLWNALLADLSTPGNKLPAEMRGNLISLALFSVNHGIKVTVSNAPIAPLIDINLAMMRGLRGEQ